MPDPVAPIPLPDRETVIAWLKQHVRKPPRSWVGRLFGEPAEYDYELTGEPQVEEQGFFVRHTLCTVTGDMDLLPRPALPGGSWGTFATDGKGLRLLRPYNGSVEQLLRDEGRPLEDGDPVWLGDFIANQHFSEGCHNHVVVADRDAIADLVANRLPFREWNGYLVDAPTLAKVAPAIPHAAITSQPAGGWCLEFATLFGWMHEIGELGVERIQIDAEFRITSRHRTILTDRLFRGVPAIRY